MSLDDIDWEAGETIVRGKGHRHDHLPIPRDVGDALVEYLRRDRPPCASRRVFICRKAPRRGFAGPVAISIIVRRAIDRAGLRTARPMRMPRGSVDAPRMPTGTCTWG
jgi:integrase